MTESTHFDEIAKLMAGAARAHHEATGGDNPGWARWYAEHLIDDVNRTLGSDMEADELAGWLVEADRRYTEESPSQSWPKAYAGWLIEGQATG